MRSTDVECVLPADCGEHGVCNSGYCQCDKGYITWDNSGPCAYQQKKKLDAFLFSFFLGGFGVDWFVLSRGQAPYIVAGVFKLLMSVFGCCIALPCMIAAMVRGSESCKWIGKGVSCLVSLGASIWCLVDWIRVLADAFKDGNGAPLKPW